MVPTCWSVQTFFVEANGIEGDQLSQSRLENGQRNRMLPAMRAFSLDKRKRLSMRSEVDSTPRRHPLTSANSSRSGQARHGLQLQAVSAGRSSGCTYLLLKDHLRLRKNRAVQLPATSRRCTPPAKPTAAPGLAARWQIWQQLPQQEAIGSVGPRGEPGPRQVEAEELAPSAPRTRLVQPALMYSTEIWPQNACECRFAAINTACGSILWRFCQAGHMYCLI